MSAVAFRVLISLAFAATALAGTSKQPLPPGFTVTNSSQEPGSGQAKMTSMPLIAPLFIEDERRTSVITIVSDAPSSSLDVDIIVLNPSGEPLAKQTVSISARGEKMVAVADLLAALPISWPVYGSIYLKPHRNSTFAAQLSITGRAGASVEDVEEEFAMVMDEKPANYRAVTVLESPFIAVRSLSGKQQTVTIDCLNRNEGRAVKSSAISIAPNQMLLLRVCSDAGAVPVPDLAETEMHGQDDRKMHPVALSLSSSTPASKLSVFGVGILVRDSRPGLSAIPFTDVNELNSSKEIFTGAATVATTTSGGALTLQATLANFGAEARAATVLLSSNGEQKVLQTLALPPGSVSPVRVIDLPGNADGSLVVQANGAPGEVLSNIQAVQVSGTSPLSAPLPWKDGKQIPNGGQHPWRIDGAFPSTLMLYNPDTQESNSVQVSVYANGKEWTENVSMAPLSTVPVSINEIVDGQHSDDKGRTVPREAVHGLATWLTLSTPKVFGMLVQSDSVNGVVRPYACAETYAVCDVSASSLTLHTGSSNNAYANILGCGTNGDCSCVESCGSGGASPSTYFWYLGDNSGVASLTSNPAASYGQYRGNKVGNTYSAVNVGDNLGCSASGTGPIKVTCPVPTGETTTFSKWGDNDPGAGNSPAVAEWVQALTPAGNYSNGTIIESNFSPATDGCWFSGSAYPPTYGVNGTQWPVGTVGQWGPDDVGYPNYAEFAYYQTTRPQRGLTMPCNVTLFQRLTYKCSDGANNVYDDDTLQVTISGTGITVTREGQTVARTLIGH